MANLVKLSAYTPALQVAQCDVQFTTGTPTNVAPNGSLSVKIDGTATTGRLFINTDGGTTWTLVK